MSAKTKIKRDSLGLYVIAGGYMSRPIYGTKFKEGDVVRSHHFGGSDMAGVTHPSETHDKSIYNFKFGGKMEIWCTCGGYRPVDETDPISVAETMRKIEWYKDLNKGVSHIYKKNNLEFE